MSYLNNISNDHKRFEEFRSCQAQQQLQTELFRNFEIEQQNYQNLQAYHSDHQEQDSLFYTTQNDFNLQQNCDLQQNEEGDIFEEISSFQNEINECQNKSFSFSQQDSLCFNQLQENPIIQLQRQNQYQQQILSQNLYMEELPIQQQQFKNIDENQLQQFSFQEDYQMGQAQENWNSKLNSSFELQDNRKDNNQYDQEQQNNKFNQLKKRDSSQLTNLQLQMIEYQKSPSIQLQSQQLAKFEQKVSKKISKKRVNSYSSFVSNESTATYISSNTPQEMVNQQQFSEQTEVIKGKKNKYQAGQRGKKLKKLNYHKNSKKQQQIKEQELNLMNGRKNYLKNFSIAFVKYLDQNSKNIQKIVSLRFPLVDFNGIEIQEKRLLRIVALEFLRKNQIQYLYQCKHKNGSSIQNTEIFLQLRSWFVQVLQKQNNILQVMKD
ncbi:hypothetical protein PPERSA_01563 [Pseudocohnilembus persalinus]|uniref:Uncharacterized protein n=1 Tax=Pseudocohnilembus persalinus TaxID=266149 RepID=A0A0V0QHF8_PSEPJ|nr:hypothetical protein PPERSA_01563 [Pseudocohnilembus persalinus]|eukprot:KRX01693.1 hypothetical protein PPERSA_01563 [Pseudocohnilembus persalinus]